MKFKTLAVSLLVFAVVGFALATAGDADTDDINLLMFDEKGNVRDDDFLAKPVHKAQQLEGEHQANDIGAVIIIGIEVCNGVPI